MNIPDITEKMIKYSDGNTHDINHFLKVWVVKRIDEDDFGCEERLPGSPRMVIVTLEDTEGNIREIRANDRELYDNNINEGDSVLLKCGNNLEKIDAGRAGKE